MENKNTAMMEFIKCINESEHTLPIDLQVKALECLSMEKEQIINAAHRGVDFENSPYKDAEKYYKETYGKATI